MLPQCSHITRKRGVYTYRRRLPKAYSGEVAISLRTSHFRWAQAMAEALDIRFEQFFRQPQMNALDIKEKLRAYLREEVRRLREDQDDKAW